MLKMTPQLKEIQKNMRPGSLSAEGFLGSDTRSLAAIINDDQEVIDRYPEIDHRLIAARMKEITAIGAQGLERSVKIGPDYEVRVEDHRGKIPCPFRDRHHATKRKTLLWHRPSNRQLEYSDLQVHMIEAHGFYQGRGGRYRIEPQQLIEMLFPELKEGNS